MKSMSCRVSCIVLVMLWTATAQAGDWPQWRGPDRTDVSQETGLLQQWPAGGPKKLWTFDNAGAGYAGMAVVGDTLYTMGARGGTELLIAVNLANGTQKWATAMGPALENGWGDGPRGTPAVDGDRVYALSGEGFLTCCKTSDGERLWQVRMQALGGKIPNWGYAESVLVDGERVLCTPGGRQGAIVALDKHTGDILWQSSEFTENAHYSSIIPIEFDGKRQYVQLTMSKVAGVDAETGNLLWTSDWPGRTAVIPTPIFKDGKVYVTSGYGAGCKLVQLGGRNPQEVYSNTIMKNHHGGVVLVGDHLYGYSDQVGWTCQDFETGKLVWNERRALGKGSVTYADGRLYCVGESDGAVVLAEASPGGWTEHGRFKLSPQSENRSPRGRIWTHPTVANGKLYLRDQELISCYDISAKQ